MFKNIIKSSAIFTLGNMMPLLTSVVLLFPYTENLSTSLYGELALYIAFTIFIQFTANYGLDNFIGINHYQYKSNPAQLNAFIGSVVGLILLIGGLLIVIFTVLGNFLFNALFDATLTFFPYGFMSVITGVCNAFFRTYINFLFYKDQPSRHFKVNLFNFIVTVSITTVGIYSFPQSLIGPMWGRFISGLLIFFLALFLFQREYRVRWDMKYLKGIHAFCLPVYFYVLLGWVVFYANNFIVNYFANLSDVGIYDFALKCVLLIEVVQTAIAATINPRVYQIWSDKSLQQSSAEENRYHHVFTLFSIWFIAGCITVLPILIQIFVRNEAYYEVFSFLPVLAAAFSFRVLTNMFTNPLLFYKKTYALPRSLGISSVFQIVSCWLLMPYLGLWGAVWSYFISKLVVAFFTWMEARKIFKFSFNQFKLIYLPLFYVAFVLLIQHLLSAQPWWYAAVLQLIVAILLSMMAFRKDLRNYRLLFR